MVNLTLWPIEVAWFEALALSNRPLQCSTIVDVMDFTFAGSEVRRTGFYLFGQMELLG
jgi:hypothetical protein